MTDINIVNSNISVNQQHNLSNSSFCLSNQTLRTDDPSSSYPLGRVLYHQEDIKGTIKKVYFFEANNFPVFSKKIKTFHKTYKEMTRYQRAYSWMRTGEENVILALLNPSKIIEFLKNTNSSKRKISSKNVADFVLKKNLQEGENRPIYSKETVEAIISDYKLEEIYEDHNHDKQQELVSFFQKIGVIFEERLNPSQSISTSVIRRNNFLVTEKVDIDPELIKKIKIKNKKIPTFKISKDLNKNIYFFKENEQFDIFKNTLMNLEWIDDTDYQDEKNYIEFLINYSSRISQGHLIRARCSHIFTIMNQGTKIACRTTLQKISKKYQIHHTNDSTGRPFISCLEDLGMQIQSDTCPNSLVEKMANLDNFINKTVNKNPYTFISPSTTMLNQIQNQNHFLSLMPPILTSSSTAPSLLTSTTATNIVIPFPTKPMPPQNFRIIPPKTMSSSQSLVENIPNPQDKRIVEYFLANPDSQAGDYPKNSNNSDSSLTDNRINNILLKYQLTSPQLRRNAAQDPLLSNPSSNLSGLIDTENHSNKRSLESEKNLSEKKSRSN